MKKLHVYFAFAFAAVLALGGATADAQLRLDLNGSGSNSNSGRISTDDADVSTDINVNTDAQVDTRGDGSPEDTTDSQGVNVDARDTSVSSDARLDVDADSSGRFSISREDIKADVSNEGETSEEVRVTNWADVQSDSDLRSFARSSFASDENLEGMTFSNDSIEVKYRDAGRFLGIFPVSPIVTVEIDAEGEVEVEYPWYSFLVTGDRQAEVKSLIEAEIESMNVLADGEWTATERAEIAALIQAAFRGETLNNGLEGDAQDDLTATSTATSTTSVSATSTLSR